MDNSDSEFLKRIQATFRIEAEDHIKSFAKGIEELEKSPSAQVQIGLIETMFREIHSLKGAARSVNHKGIESLCQPLENVFSILKKQEIILTPQMIDLFYQNSELLSDLISTGVLEKTSGIQQNLRDQILQLSQVSQEIKSTNDNEGFLRQIENEPETTPETIRVRNQNLKETVRIPISKLEPLLSEAEEFIQTKIANNQHTDELIEMLRNVTEWKAETYKWKIQRKTASEVQREEWQDKNELWLIGLETQLAKVARSMERDQYSLDRMVDDHLDSMTQILMLPVSYLVEIFPGMVREISRDQQKDIEFRIIGSELEIDKRILEELKDPLIHLIRNSIDHGIGLPNERILENKPQQGKIILSFTAKESGQVEITVTDDGKGIDLKRVIEAAVKSEIILPEAIDKLSPDNVLNLIFRSGLSTSPIITDLSGRGLGLSIVCEKVEKLNGILSIETKEKIGTTFRILLPMNLAAFRGILVSEGDFLFMLPTMNVERVIRVKPQEIKTIENHETIRIGDEIISVLSLAEVLQLPIQKNVKNRLKPIESITPGYFRLLVLISGPNRMAFKVEDVLDEYQVLVKGLGKLLKRVRNISGVTILGSGRIVPVIHVSDLMKSAVKIKGTAKVNAGKELPATISRKILVAEDSITSRTMLKNILETAGYQVITAVDGVDAYTHVINEDFDLIVSDVDMPRMNGFELTSKIKKDKTLGEIPVVLVTSLESREDRERGIDAGADAYIIKSKFDQGNLLEVIKKLI